MNEVFVLDTNFLISAFLFPDSIPKKAYNLAKSKGFICVSDETFNEFREVFLIPKFDK